MQSKHNKAFTLVEVLLAMAITAIIVLAIHGAYRQGSILWNRSEVDAPAYHQIKTITETLRTEIGSMYLQKPAKDKQDDPEQSGEDTNTKHNFILTNSELSFYTLNPSYNTSHRYGKISKVTYLIETNDETGHKTLKRIELLAAGGKTIELPSDNTNKIDTLTSGIFSELSFQAYIENPETKELTWKKSYQSNSELPRAIAIHINKPETKYTQSYKSKLIFPVITDTVPKNND